MGNELDFVVGQFKEDDHPRLSDWMFTCNAFFHLTLPVGDLFMSMPRDAEIAFKPLVDAYGVALRDYCSDTKQLYRTYCSLFDKVYEFEFGDQHQCYFIDPFLTKTKLEFFRLTIKARREHGSFQIHPNNNAWMLIVYVLRHVVQNFESDVVSPFKMIPLFDIELIAPLNGWVQIPARTSFLSVTSPLDMTETAPTVWSSHTVTFTRMEGFDGNTCYPVLIQRNGSTHNTLCQAYIQPDCVIFYA